ncbi:LuxR family transcriptional regulator [Streptomyces sp. NPDC021093]|uniref:LuxR family transcriptional regulator n=1 Tax=Streptomyces sp. NPDC021093 TaxID=3365112 RepID=UPI00378823CC
MVSNTKLQGRHMMTNTHTTGNQARLQRLNAVDMQVYGWAVTHGCLVVADAAAALGLPREQVARSASALASISLFRLAEPLTAGSDPEAPEPVWNAVDPQMLAAEVAANESRLRRGLAELYSVWDTMDSLAALYAAGTDNEVRTAPLEIVDSLDAAISLIQQASAGCRHELMTSQPGGGRPAGELEEAFQRDLAMLQRGVQMRSLYQHTSRRHAPTQEYAERVTAAGAQVRTLPELLGRMIAFDRSVVFLPHHEANGGAVVVRDPSTVAFLCNAFDHSWGIAVPYSPTDQDRTVRADLAHTILSLLSEGLKDDAIARRLGVSLRTCRKYIAEIFKDLSAESRFQAGYLTGTKDLLADRPHAPRP